MEDEMIIDLFFERSEQAISELSTKYGKLAQVICTNILKNGPDAEECVNDSLFTTWNSIPPEKPTSLRAFFLNVVRNKALDRYRFNTAARRNSNFEVAIEELETCLFSGADPVDECEADVLSDAIDRFLKTLKKKDRQMFVCRYYLSDSIQTIAQNMGLKESAVSLKLFRTRERLRKFLRKENLI